MTRHEPGIATIVGSLILLVACAAAAPFVAASARVEARVRTRKMSRLEKAIWRRVIKR